MPGRLSRVTLSGAVVVAALAVVSLLASCGGGSSDSSTAGSGQGQSGASPAGIASFGEQASPAERAAATTSVQGFARAWIDGDSAKACSLMSASTKQNLAVFESKLKGCTAQVEGLRATMPAKTLARLRGIQVAGMRVRGDRGYLLYRDAQGTSSAFPVVREGSSWKVGAIVGTRIP